MEKFKTKIEDDIFQTLLKVTFIEETTENNKGIYKVTFAMYLIMQ